MPLTPCDHNACPKTHCDLKLLNEAHAEADHLLMAARASLRIIMEEKVRPIEESVKRLEQAKMKIGMKLNAWWKKNRKDERRYKPIPNIPNIIGIVCPHCGGDWMSFPLYRKCQQCGAMSDEDFKKGK